MAEVPASVTNFAFVCITSAIGFLLIFAVFFNELFRVDRKHIMQSLILSVENLVFNLFLLKGSSGLDSTTISCVISAYFAFIPIVEFVMHKTKPNFNTILAIIIVIIGLFFMMNLDITKLFNVNIFFLIICDIAFAVYIVTTGDFAKASNPSILSMGLLFFNAVIGFVCWFIESTITHIPMYIPKNPLFWGSVIFISFFIRGMYTVVQTYAQRFVSPLNTSLIFSLEIILTMLLSDSAASFFSMDLPKQELSIFKIIGAVIMIVGILLADSAVWDTLVKKEKKVING